MLRLERTAKQAQSPGRLPGGAPHVVAGPKPWLEVPSGGTAPPPPAERAGPDRMQAEAPMQGPMRCG